jgi:hypothetical protein
MPRRIDVPLGGMHRKRERQRTEREDARTGKRDRIEDAFEQLSRSRGRSKRSWLKGLAAGRAPFPRR